MIKNIEIMEILKIFKVANSFRISVIVFLFISILNASIVNDFINKKYEKICSFANINKYYNDEKALSIIGVSCVKSDKIYLLPYVINKLKKTRYARKNSIYFSIILLQKKLLYSYMFDNISLESYSFPMTDYVLSVVFEAIKSNNFKKVEDKIIVKKGKKTYIIYKIDDKMYIDEFENDKLIKKRWYR